MIASRGGRRGIISTSLSTSKGFFACSSRKASTPTPLNCQVKSQGLEVSNLRLRGVQGVILGVLVIALSSSSAGSSSSLPSECESMATSPESSGVPSRVRSKYRLSATFLQINAHGVQKLIDNFNSFAFIVSGRSHLLICNSLQRSAHVNPYTTSLGQNNDSRSVPSP